MIPKVVWFDEAFNGRAGLGATEVRLVDLRWLTNGTVTNFALHLQKPEVVRYITVELLLSFKHCNGYQAFTIQVTVQSKLRLNVE